MQRLISDEGDANETPRNSIPPLILAIRKHGNSLRLVNSLIKGGAGVNVSDHSGRTAAHLATRLGELATLDLLLEAGADVNRKDQGYRTPLHIAVRHRHHNIVERLIKYGALLDVWWELTTPRGNYSILAPLHIAVMNGDLKMVRILVNANASLEIFDNCNKTPYDRAVECGRNRIRRLLLNVMAKEGVSTEMRRHLIAKDAEETATECLPDPLCDIPSLDLSMSEADR